MVGIPRTPYFVGWFGCSSILCFAITISLLISSEISSKIGPICLQGPHHSAQKSTKVGFEPFAKMVDNTQEINIEKNLLLYIVEPSKDNLEHFMAFRKKHGEYKEIHSPWQF